MANNGWVIFRKNIDMDAIEALFRDLNATKFDGKLVVNRAENGFDIETPDNGSFWYEVISKRKLKWRQRYDDAGWWQVNFMGHNVARRFDPNCVVRDEGISETMTPEFDLTYPTAQTWVDKLRVSFARIRALKS